MDGSKDSSWSAISTKGEKKSGGAKKANLLAHP